MMTILVIIYQKVLIFSRCYCHSNYHWIKVRYDVIHCYITLYYKYNNIFIRYKYIIIRYTVILLY